MSLGIWYQKTGVLNCKGAKTSKFPNFAGFVTVFIYLFHFIFFIFFSIHGLCNDAFDWWRKQLTGDDAQEAEVK
jgi:hypothetical protein